MKIQMVATCLLVALMLACTDKSKEASGFQCPEKWQLVKMTGGLANTPPSTGGDMAWQEWYLLYPGKKFTKTRQRDNVTTELQGTYAIVTLSDEQYLELTYQSSNELIGNCTGEPKELLKIIYGNTLQGTWQICDGPGLYYEKVPYDCKAR